MARFRIVYRDIRVYSATIEAESKDEITEETINYNNDWTEQQKEVDGNLEIVEIVPL